MKRFLLVPIYFFIITISLLAQDKSSLRYSIDTLLANDFFSASIASVSVYDLSANEILYNRSEKLLLHPASNMKVLTSTAGLIFLGPDYTFKTKLAYTGELIDGTILGDLYIIGGMDPDFTSDDLDTLINSITVSGIKEISGDLIGDVSIMDSLFWGQGWMWDDDPSTDAPYMTALNINDNAVEVIVKPGKINKPADVLTNPVTSFFQIENNSNTTSVRADEDLSISRDWINRTNKIIVNGSIYTGRREFSTNVNVYNPKHYFLSLLKEKLIEQGVKVSGGIKFDITPATAMIFQTTERRYDSVIVNLDKTSDNLSAEMTLRAMGCQVFGPPADANKGLLLIDSLIELSGMNPSSYRLVDGSGVSHYNLVSAELMVSVLKYVYFARPELYNILYNAFPIAGVDGTLRSRMKGTAAENNVHAKTGTLSGISTLSGYVQSADGDMLAFSILIQNHVRNTAKAIYFQNEICRLLAEFK